MDESGLAVGSSQSSRALVNIRKSSSWKQIGSRQGWITAIECAPLKRALASETDATLRLDTGRISRVECVEMYIRARQKALTSNNIRSGWRGAGLAPLSPIVVLEKLLVNPASAASPPHTPLRQTDLDLSLLESSPPDGTELRQANALLNSTIKACRIFLRQRSVSRSG